MKPRAFLSFFLIMALVGGCGNPLPEDEALDRLLIYCGTTMRYPVQEIAASFEKMHNCRVAIIQGGSEDLYQSLGLSRQGDLYLPGMPTYRWDHLAEGLLADYVYVGDNQAALIVQKGNPKNINTDIMGLADHRYAVIIGNSESSSIGLCTQIILEKAGIYEEVVRGSIALAAASRNISRSIVEDGLDLALNWRVTAGFAENKDLMDVLLLPDAVAPKMELFLNLLSFSKNPELAKKFMLHAVSPAGQAIFMKYGFLEEVSGQGALQR